jgi:hypothetical protein
MILFGHKKYGIQIGTETASGFVFYDKGFYSNGWRYMEAAKSDTETTLQWGGRGIETSATGTAVGTGAANTAAILAFWAAWINARLTTANGGTWDGTPIDSVDYSGVQTELGAGKIPSRYKWDGIAANDPTTWSWMADYGAKYCDSLTSAEKSDWFMPSTEELNLIYQNLKLAGIGGFADNYYWSSSDFISNGAWNQNFNNGNQDYGNKHTNQRVRAVRAF